VRGKRNFFLTKRENGSERGKGGLKGRQRSKKEKNGDNHTTGSKKWLWPSISLEFGYKKRLK